jgi:ABC-type antimicrobial peptide transport system permease subunit
MWGFIQTLMLSIFAVVIIHYIWDYIKNTYSVRKTKDLVKIQTDKYDTILSEMLENKNNVDPSQMNMEEDLSQFLEKTISEL